MLTQRQRMILGAIIEDYVRSAEPIGSRALSKQMSIPLSPATIRNEMADLEEMGFLDQPHTSAGRIPSHKGYRFYVDNLMSTPAIDMQTAQTMRELFVRRIGEYERAMQQTSQILSDLTQYTSIVQAPVLRDGCIKHVQLVPIGNGSAVAILVTDTGHVENRHVKLDEQISPDELVAMVNMLNTRLKGVPIGRVKSKLHREIANEMANALEHYEDAIAVLDELCMHGAEEADKVFVGGTSHMLAQPEFRDIDKLRPVLAALEHAGQAHKLLSPSPVGGVNVRIGEENSVESLQECTVVSATYFVGDTPIGSIGLLGPTRMNYARTTQILDYVARLLTKALTDAQGGG